MAEAVAAFDVAEVELLDELLRPADLLVDLDRPPRAHHAQVGTALADPRLHLPRFRLDDDDGVVRADSRLVRAAEGRCELAAEASHDISGSDEKSVSLLEPLGAGSR